MTTKIILLFITILLVGCSDIDMNEQNNKTSDSNDDMMTEIMDSNRHQEWVEIDNNGKTIYSWIVYPESDEKSSVVLLIHENKGLTDWVRATADKIAAEGYIVIAPDLLSSYSDDLTQTSDFENDDKATKALYSIKQDTIISDLKAVSDYAKTLSASNGNLASIGFCWGGSQSYLFATQSDDLTATLVFYGTAPEEESIYDNIEAPVYGFYGGDDTRVNSTLPQTQSYMDENEKTFEYIIYPGAGHAFMRVGESADASPENKNARNQAWDRMLDLLSEM